MIDKINSMIDNNDNDNYNHNNSTQNKFNVLNIHDGNTINTNTLPIYHIVTLMVDNNDTNWW